MPTNAEKLTAAEQELVACAVEIAKLKARMGAIERAGKLYSPDLAKLQRLESNEKHLTGQRQLLSRQVAEEYMRRKSG